MWQMWNLPKDSFMCLSQTNCNCYQDQAVTQKAEQPTETTESKKQEGENTPDVSGNGIAFSPKLPARFSTSL